MKGSSVLKHPDKTEIERMFNEGYTVQEVHRWLKQKHKHKMYWLSEVTLQEYRNNFLKLDKQQLAKLRKELLESGNTKDANVIESFTAAKEFTESREKATAEIVNALENFKSIQDKVLERINLVERETMDNDGNPVYKPRNEEILEKYLGRLESMTNSFIKLQEFLEKKNAPINGSTEIQITMTEMSKYSDFFKKVMQKTITKIDPALLNGFFEDFEEEKNKTMSEMGIEVPGQKVNISIKNKDNQVKVTTVGGGDMVTKPAKEEPYIDIPAEDV